MPTEREGLSGWSLTSDPIVRAAACMRSLNAVLYFALMTLNSSKNENDGMTWNKHKHALIKKKTLT